MSTHVLKVDPSDPDQKLIGEAAAVIRRGGLVAFPTETVYGLGANALNSAAVTSIYAAKGRPASNPIIVHVLDATEARSLVTVWPDAAERLSARFWPGPLTFVLPRAAGVPLEVTAGGGTVAVRAPSHPVARALLKESAVPIAAPSANRSTQVSPTEARHVLKGLDGRIEMLLDGGRCPGGIESTVIDLTTDPPRILRPGLVTARAIAAAIGAIQDFKRSTVGERARSPGMMERHYSPDARVELIQGSAETRARELAGAGLRVGWLKMEGLGTLVRSDTGTIVLQELPAEPKGYAAGLYAALHAMDEAGVSCILVEEPDEQAEWAAVRDRLSRAATPQ